jgi:hypothetical protein
LRPRLGIDYTIRMAYPFEGPVIGDLYQGTLIANLDWERPLDASWVIAVHPTQPEYYGVVSLVASQPIGRLEMLRVRLHLNKRIKACVVRDLIHYSLLTLKAYGCQAVTGASEQELVSTFGKVIQQRFHGTPIGQFTGYITRLT